MCMEETDSVSTIWSTWSFGTCQQYHPECNTGEIFIQVYLRNSGENITLFLVIDGDDDGDGDGDDTLNESRSSFFKTTDPFCSKYALTRCKMLWRHTIQYSHCFFIVLVYKEWWYYTFIVLNMNIIRNNLSSYLAWNIAVVGL